MLFINVIYRLIIKTFDDKFKLIVFNKEFIDKLIEKRRTKYIVFNDNITILFFNELI